MLSTVFENFVKKSPISVMSRGLAERMLNPELLNEWFKVNAEQQYNRSLMFSTVVAIMCQVVTKMQPSVHAAFQAAKEEISVSVTSLYNKLNGIEPNISAGLVRYASGQAATIITKLGGAIPSPLPGLRLKLLDGNCIEKSQHRLKELRDIAAGPLPGKSLVVYDPMLRLPIDVFPCEDGHAQERSMLKSVLQTIEANDVWVADRNFCTAGFTCGIAAKEAFFIIREHSHYPVKVLDHEKYIGKTETGKVYEHHILVTDEDDKEYIFRRIRIHLKKETRDGDSDIFIITNLSKSKANAKKIAELYQGRWTIETAFQHLTLYFNSEINTLGYPRAALFGFCIGLVSYMMLSVIKAAIGSVHGLDVAENRISGYYIANEIAGTYSGMMIAIDDAHWTVFQQLTFNQLTKVLKKLTGNIRISAYRKHTRGPKKPRPKRKGCKSTPHVSTAKLIALVSPFHCRSYPLGNVRSSLIFQT